MLGRAEMVSEQTYRFTSQEPFFDVRGRYRLPRIGVPAHVCHGRQILERLSSRNIPIHVIGESILLQNVFLQQLIQPSGEISWDSLKLFGSRQWSSHLDTLYKVSKYTRQK